MSILPVLFSAALLGAPAAVQRPADRLADPVYLAGLTAPGDDAARWDSLGTVWGETPQDLAPARNLRLPVNYHANGRVKVLLLAQEAWVHPSNTVLRAQEVEVRLLSDRGVQEGTLRAERLVVDRSARIGRAFGAVEMVSDRNVMKGNGALFDVQTQYVRILSDAYFMTRRFGDGFAMKGIFESKKGDEQ